eukprot:COSAG02_NODE_958_length_15648_cov_5.487620_12_plen_91_part_00
MRARAVRGPATGNRIDRRSPSASLGAPSRSRMAQQAWIGEADGSADDETEMSAADSNLKQEPQRARTVDGSVSANDANELATIRVRTMYG